MNKLNCNLKNCYGIQNLQCEFDFSDTNAIAIYARNGLMKTSFSKTFKKIQDNKCDDIKDEIFNISGTVDVKIDDLPIESNKVFVIKSFESFYESNSITSLLVDDTIKARINDVLKLKDKFLKLLEKHSGLKIVKTSVGKKIYELEPTIVDDFHFAEESFLLNIKELGTLEPNYICSNIKYSSIFDSTVLKKILSSEFQDKIIEFCVASDGIYAEYGFLEKGNFTLPKLKNISKTLNDDKFFVRNNHIYLEGGYEINDSDTLKEKISEIEGKIKEVPVFQEIEKMLSDAKGLVLKDVIENNPDLVTYLQSDKLDELKKELWLSYIKKEEAKFQELLTAYESLETEIGNVDLDETPWKNALNVFEERFTVPYKMKISNMKGAIIGESIPRIEFMFERDGQTIKMDRNNLESIDVLSQGEKRALYLLNIIFDIQRIRQSGDDILFVIDDIADSFDYKNKYAIVEYLYDMSNEDNFNMIVLSHNFDFYRTVSQRLSLKRNHKLCAEAEGNNIELKQEKYQDKPFTYWKDNMNLVNVVALIPFVRNMVEYGEDKNKGQVTGIGSDYLLFTYLLHKKSESRNIKFDVIKKLYKEYFGKDNFASEIDLNDVVIDKIDEIAGSVTSANADLEYKIILSIAIRHLAEEFMLDKISRYSGILTWRVRRNSESGSASDFLNRLGALGNQTRELFNAYKQFGSPETIKFLDKVNIMTPENIHLNSFMYEPILDMDINELLNLYQKAKAL